LRGHGNEDMPAAISNLVHYIWSLQRESAGK
jgi:hypothetical protein